jgi:hypothetical protein
MGRTGGSLGFKKPIWALPTLKTGPRARRGMISQLLWVEASPLLLLAEPVDLQNVMREAHHRPLAAHFIDST